MASKILVYSTPEFYSTPHTLQHKYWSASIRQADCSVLTLEMESRTFREMRDAALADAEGARAELRNNKSAYEELFSK